MDAIAEMTTPDFNLPLYAAFAWFSWVGSITPGPNCSLALAVGIHHGVSSVWRHALGICIGLGGLMMLGLWGTLDLFNAWPLAALALKYFGIAYLAYLGYCFMRARGGIQDHGAEYAVPRPRIMQSAILQVSNPKAWLLITGTLGAYQGMSRSFWFNALLILGTLFACVIAAVYIWAWLGQSIRHWLSQGTRMRAFNILLGVSLILTALWLILQ